MKKTHISIYVILIIIVAVIFSLSGFNVDKKEIIPIGAKAYDQDEDYN
ncbi:hypothetical protein [Aquimarina algiphila]|nr:hypothetical protein [Aquimarina algiphila]